MSRKNKKTLNLRSDLSDELIKAAQASQFAKQQEEPTALMKALQGSSGGVNYGDRGVSGGGKVQYNFNPDVGISANGHFSGQNSGIDGVSAIVPLAGGELAFEASKHGKGRSQTADVMNQTGMSGEGMQNNWGTPQSYIGAQFTRNF